MQKGQPENIGVIMRLKNLIPTRAELQLYICHLVWHLCRASDTRRLEGIQERGLRAVFKDDRSSYDVLFKRAELPTLKNRRLQDICIWMYKVKNGLSPNPIRELFKPHQSSYRLRQSVFSLPRFATVTYTGSILWRCCSILNCVFIPFKSNPPMHRSHALVVTHPGPKTTQRFAI